MGATLNAFGILTVAITTILIVRRFGSLPIETRLRSIEVARAVRFPAFLAAAASLTSCHMCNAGDPLSQWLVPAICAFAVSLTLVPGKARSIVQLSLLGVSIGLSQHYVYLVHSGRYNGNPKYLDYINDMQAKETSARTYQKAVWWSLWHSRFTGIYGVKEVTTTVNK